MSLWIELKRRNVVKVGMAYIVVGWIMLEVASVLAPALSLPEWTMTFVVFVLTLGFPIALVLAWAYELTPGGVKRAADVPTDEDTPVAGQTLNYVVTGLLVAAVAFLVVQNLYDGGDDAAASADADPSLPESQSTASDVLPNSVAVLPFDNLSPDPNNAYFAAGIHESTLNQLAKIRDLNVIARTSVLQYGTNPVPIPEIAEALNVETVMEGSVRYANDRVLITAQLIDGRTGTHIWSEEYDRDLADVFAVQGEIAQRIAMALEAELTEDERVSIEQPPTSSQEAHALYLRAMAIWDGSEFAVGSPTVRESVRADLDQAIAVDSEFALAYVERAFLAMMILNLDPGAVENFTSRLSLEQRAVADLEWALDIDPGLGAAHFVLARIHQYNWRADEAQAAYERALELSPNDSRTLSNYAHFSAVQGRTAEATRLARRAVELDPNSGDRYVNLAGVNIVSGDFAGAAETLRRGIELAPAASNLYKDLAQVELLLGDNEGSLARLRSVESLYADNTNPVFQAEIAYYYGRLGQAEDASRIFRWLEERSTTLRVPQVGWILAYLAIGDEAQSLEWMRRAADEPQFYEGHFGTAWLAINGYHDPVLEQPEFVEARSRIAFGSQ